METPAALERRFVSKLDGAGDWLDEGAWVVDGGAEGDLPRDEDVDVIIVHGRRGKGRCELLKLK
jgi:hypothetical protein